MDVLTVFGLFLGVSAILVGQYLEGGSVSMLINPAAMMIVLGGTMGAIMLQSTLSTFIRAAQLLVWVIWPPNQMKYEAIDKIVSWSNIARKEGLLGLENISESEVDSFSRTGLQLLVDGSEPEVMRNILEIEVNNKEHHDIQAAKVYESMGAYTPTLGIIGAVMGLIQVMQNLSDPAKLGEGIAVAFVATIYGVGLANLLLIPIANKLKSLVVMQAQYRYMIAEGIVSIAEGENPRNIETKLKGYLH